MIDYRTLLERAFTILRARPFLIVMGVLAGLGGGSSFYSFGGNNNANVDLPNTPPNGADIPMPSVNFPDIGALPLALLIIGAMLLLMIGVVIWAISTVAHGSLVAGVNEIEEGRSTSFGPVWQMGWRRAWQLIGINLLPAIPMLFMAVLGVIMFMSVAGFAALSAETLSQVAGGASAMIFICGICILVPVTIVLSVLSSLAFRAAMIEETGVFDSYRRAWSVLTQNLGSVIIIFILQLLIGLALMIVLFVPGIFVALCCLLWPLFLLVSGAVTAYFSTVWTLAWRHWTGLSTVLQPPAPGSLRPPAAPGENG